MYIEKLRTEEVYSTPAIINYYPPRGDEQDEASLREKLKLAKEEIEIMKEEIKNMECKFAEMGGGTS